MRRLQCRGNGVRKLAKSGHTDSTLSLLGEQLPEPIAPRWRRNGLALRNDEEPNPHIEGLGGIRDRGDR